MKELRKNACLTRQPVIERKKILIENKRQEKNNAQSQSGSAAMGVLLSILIVLFDGLVG